MRILKLDETEFVIIGNDKPRYVSTLEKLIVQCAKIGMKFNEIEIALIEMVKNDHNFAEFGGIRKSFMYTGKV